LNVFRAFRCLLVTQPLLFACALVILFFTGDPQSDLNASEIGSYEPDALDNALSWVEAELAPWAINVLLLVLLALYFATLIGLFYYRRWARTLFVIGFLIGIALVPLTSGESVSSIDAIFDTLMVTLDGAIMALAFLGPVAETIDRGAPNKSLVRTR